jgi:hypothetical protein
LKLKIQNPVTLFCRAKASGWRRDLFRKEKSLRPEHLFAGVQKLQQRPGRSPGFCIIAQTKATIFTVARPRGILTRFPILPALSGTPKRILKEPGNVTFRLIAGASYHAHRRKSKNLRN